MIKQRPVSTIVILTQKFPFEIGEEFIENEIEFAIQYASMIIIIPLGVSDYSMPRINSTNSIYVVKGVHKRPKALRLLSALRYIIDRNVIKEMKTLCASGNVRKALRCLLYYERYNSLVDEITLVLKKNKNCKGEIVLYSYWMDIGAMVAGELRRRIAGSVAIARAHGFDLYTEERNEFLPFRQYTLDGLNMVSPISQHGLGYMKQRFPHYKDIFNAFYLGTNDHGLNPESKREDFYIVSCSRLVPIKRVNLIIDALSLIKDKSIIWIHFGDGVLREQLNSKASNQLQRNIKWKFYGHVKNHELIDIYKKKHFDIFVNVSESEGLPVSIMEALSFGIPVIATDVGGIKEEVRHEWNGYILDKDFKATDLAETIESYYQLSNDKRKMFRNNARRWWEEEFNAEKNYRYFYNSVLNLFKSNL